VRVAARRVTQLPWTAQKRENGMIKQSVLVVEDEEDIRELVSYNLLKEGYQVAGVASGEDALAAIESKPPDLVLLDLMLPGLDGLSVCRKLKGNPLTELTPVIMLTAKGEEADIVAGLNMGADDYVTKPFSPRVLLARVKAVLRRAAEEHRPEEDYENLEEEEAIEVHDLMIHPGRHEVLVRGKSVELTATEFKLLYLLVQRPGWVFTRQQILDGVHGDNYAITERAVDVQVVGLRRKLGAAGNYLETVRGVGYRFKE
jgi:two-component system phosphate regulon response regulator PhoB